MSSDKERFMIFDPLARVLNSVLKYLVFFLLFGMMALVVIQVVSRYVFSYGFGWTEELARYLMIWAAFLGLPLALKTGHFVGMDALFLVVPQKIKLGMRIITYILLIFLLVMVFKLSLDLIGRTRQLTPALRINYIYVYLAVPTGAVLGIIQVFAFLEKTILTKELAETVLPVPEDVLHAAEEQAHLMDDGNTEKNK